MKKTPMWIGIQIPTSNGTTKICIGIDQQDGNEVSFCNEADIELSKIYGHNPWVYGGDIVIASGTDGKVFDDEHNLVKS